MGDFENRDDIFSVKVRAGRRTYFFDVKETKKGDYYLSIKESKRNHDDYYEKHTLHLYKEDFEKFFGGLDKTVSFVRSNQEVIEKRYVPREENAGEENDHGKENDEYSFQ